MANMTTPWMDMAQRFFPTISQLSGSSKRSSPDKEHGKEQMSEKRKKKKNMEVNKVNTKKIKMFSFLFLSVKILVVLVLFFFRPVYTDEKTNKLENGSPEYVFFFCFFVAFQGFQRKKTQKKVNN